jgi:hypothetical protein
MGKRETGRREKAPQALEKKRFTTGIGAPRLVAAATASAGREALAVLALPLHRGRQIGVGLLPVDAPVAQFVERDRLGGDGAAHVGAGTDDAKIAVKKFKFRFA